MVKKTSISKLSQVIQNIESLRSSLQSEREKEEDQRKLKKLSAELEAAEKRAREIWLGFPPDVPLCVLHVADMRVFTHFGSDHSHVGVIGRSMGSAAAEEALVVAAREGIKLYGEAQFLALPGNAAARGVWTTLAS
ncbi:hypothetical protein Dimus_016821 [Dionaea muscipula]